MSKHDLITCKKCSRVYFSIPRKRAEEEVTRANKFYNSCTDEMKKKHFKSEPSKIALYESCSCGNNYKDFRDFKKEDKKEGEIILPLISRKE